MIPVCCQKASPNLPNGFRGSGTSEAVIGFPALTPNKLTSRARWALALVLPFIALIEWAWTVAHASSSSDLAAPVTEASPR